MKKTIKTISILLMLLLPASARAVTMTSQGGTGFSTTTPGYLLMGSPSGLSWIQVATSSLGISSGGNVASVFGRTGTVTAQSGDYSSFYPSFSYASSSYYLSSNPSNYINSAGAPVQSVSNSDGTITCGPTSGSVVCSRPAITGDLSIPTMTNVSTLATVNGNIGSFTNANVTVNGKGLVTAVSNGISASFATTSINGLATTSFPFIISTTGTDFTISTSSVTGISFNLPTASASNRGALSSTDWSTFNGKQASGNYITALTGDISASGPGSSASSLATVNSNIGSFTDANITVNAKGLVTAASSGSGGSGASSVGVSGEVQFASTTPGSFDASSMLSFSTTTSRLGIGTSTTASRLTVTDDSNIVNQTINSSDTSGSCLEIDQRRRLSGRQFDMCLGTAGAGIFSLRDPTVPADRLTINSTGLVGIGISTATELLTIEGASGNPTNYINIATSTGASLFKVMTNGHIQIGASSTAATLQPTIVCGSGASLVGSDMNGKITCGTGVTTSFTLTFGSTFTNPPSCFMNPEYSAGAYWIVPTATTIVFNVANSAASSKIDYACYPR